ncbi:MAG: sulfurtransferase complex subunit TusD [Parashewanella sp.]
MSKFVIQVTSNAYGNSASFRAIAFAKALLSRGHSITRVFFYQDGVSHANALLCPAADEFNIHKQWRQLAQQYQLELVCCVSAALRRGVVAEQEANEENLAQFNVCPPFKMAGLGELVTAIETSDKLVTF